MREHTHGLVECGFFSIEAVDDTFDVISSESTALSVLANDLVPYGCGNVAVTITTPPSFGTAVVNPDNTIQYTADDMCAELVDQLQYMVSCTAGAIPLISNIATVTINVVHPTDCILIVCNGECVTCDGDVLCCEV